MQVAEKIDRLLIEHSNTLLEQSHNNLWPASGAILNLIHLIPVSLPQVFKHLTYYSMYADSYSFNL